MITVEEKKIVAIPHNDHIKEKCFDQYHSLKGEKRREWFSDHAYLCLPLVIGNQYGYVVKSERTFDVIWDGGKELSATKVIFKDSVKEERQRISSHFGLGIVTVQNSFTLRTTDNINLMTINPPNYYIDGVHFMTAVVECDNLRRDFTFNFKITRPNHIVSIKQGDWIGCFIPIPRYFVDEHEMVDAVDYLPKDQIIVEQQCMRDFGTSREVHDRDKPHHAGRLYFNGVDVYGNKFTDHQKRVE